MTKSLVGAKQAGQTLSTNSFTWYMPLGESGFPFVGTENQVHFRVGVAGVLSGLSCHIDSNGRSTTTTFRSRKNSANGNQVLSVTAGATGFFTDASNTDTLAAGDDVNTIGVTSTGGGTIAIDGVWAAFEATSGFASFYMSSISSIVPGFSTASASFYNSLSGGIGGAYDTSESNREVTLRCAGTFRRMFCLIGVNPRSSTTVMFFRKNNADGNQNVSIGAGATGVFQDTTNTDTVASGDKVAYRVGTGTGTGSIQPFRFGVTYDGNDNQHDIFALQNSSIQRISSSTDIFPDFFGILGVGNTVESKAKTRFPFDARLDKFRVRVFSCSTNNITFKVRKNGADGNQSVLVTTGGAGLFEDASSVDDVVVGDEVNLKGSSSTNTSSYAYFALRVNEPFVPGAGGNNRRVVIMQ